MTQAKRTRGRHQGKHPDGVKKKKKVKESFHMVQSAKIPAPSVKKKKTAGQHLKKKTKTIEGFNILPLSLKMVVLMSEALLSSVTGIRMILNK